MAFSPCCWSGWNVYPCTCNARVFVRVKLTIGMSWIPISSLISTASNSTLNSSWSFAISIEFDKFSLTLSTIHSSPSCSSISVSSSCFYSSCNVVGSEVATNWFSSCSFWQAWRWVTAWVEASWTLPWLICNFLKSSLIFYFLQIFEHGVYCSPRYATSIWGSIIVDL